MRRLLRHDKARIVTLVTLVGVALVVPFAARSHQSANERLLHTLGIGRSTQGEPGSVARPRAGVADRANPPPRKTGKPKQLHLTRAHGAVFDVRRLRSTVIKRERPEHPAPGEPSGVAGADPDATLAAPTAALPAQLDQRTMRKSSASAAAAPPPLTTFEGLDFANWGAGHPPDTNGDVGPTYYIQTINTSIGIYDKSNGNRVAAFTFDAFMSQGQFGNLCDTDNFGDPVVLYDSFEDRWFITDFAFKLDASGNVSPQTVYQCFAVSKTGDPVAGGWNFYSIETPGGLGDYPKFGVWPDGIYMTANMFGYSASSSYTGFHVWAINKQQMYVDAPAAQVVDFAGDASDFTVIPANARLQAGTPPAGTSEYFVSTEQFLNALSIYKFKVDWDKVSTSTFTGPELQLAPTCWPNASVPNAPTPANSIDTLSIRAMAQAQYSNIGGTESVWISHTVRRGESANNTTCNAPTTGNATVRWYQANVTGGTVAANTIQGKSFDPEGANTFFRFMPSLAVDRVGDMAIGYSKSNSTTNPQIKYAGRLVGDALNTLGQTEQTLIDGAGSQMGNCGSSACSRWGDYSGMALDPNGCTFWETNEYYPVTGLDHHTRIGSFQFPGCTTAGNGTLSGAVSDGSNPIAGAIVTLGSRTATTDSNGNYAFAVPAGTYPSLTAAKAGFDPASASSIAVPNGGSATRNFTLNAAAQSGCFTDDSQTAFQRGVPSNCDLTASPGAVVLAKPDNTDAKNTSVSPTGFGFTNTSWAGQTFTPTVTGQLLRVDVELFCSGCSGTNPAITLSIRNTTGTTPVPTGADLATATLAGFNDGAAGGLKTFTFSSPITLTAGTRYAFVFRANAARAGTYAYTCSCATTGFSNSNPYAGGQFVTSSNSGSTWAADTTVGGRDLNFVTYVNPGYSNGTFVSSVKDANPAVGAAPTWTTLSFSATTPAGTGVKFQVAASNSFHGPFSFVGPDGTGSTYFTTSGASLSQFNGFRYLRYKAVLSTTNGSVTPSLSSVSVCFVDNQATVTGTLTTPTAAVSAGQTGRTITFTYTAAAGGLANGALTLEVPAGWNAPSTTVGAPGYTTATPGSVSTSGQTITVSGLTRTVGQKVTITYGSRASGGTGATAPSTPADQPWQAQQRSTAGGSLVPLSSSPVITVAAADGSGAMAVTPAAVSAASTGRTLTFTYTTATGGLVGGLVRLTVPSGWSAPSTVDGSARGYTTTDKGSASVSGQQISVSGVTLAAGETLTIVYGSKASGGPGANAPGAPSPAQAWPVVEKSTLNGVLKNLSSQPVVSVRAADGSGTVTPTPTWVRPGSGGNTITLTYTAASGGMAAGEVAITVPAGWPAPSATGTDPGYTTSSAGTLVLSGQTIDVTGLNLAAGGKLTIVYGSKAATGPGVAAPASSGSPPWTAQERSTATGTLASLASQPAVTVISADGSGAIARSPATVVHSSTANRITFTYTAAQGGLVSGAVRVTVPTGWTPPSTTSTAAGYSTATTGTLSVSAQRITVSGVTLAGGQTLTIVYGETSSGGPGATASAATGAQTWQTLEKSSSAGTLTLLASQPVITVT